MPLVHIKRRGFGRMIHRRTALAGMAFLAATALGLVPAAAQDDGIVVYNAQHESLTQEWADAFTSRPASP